MGKGNLSAPISRLFVDISYTQTQTGNIGVTRTVRRLLEEFQLATQVTGLQCQPVAIHSSGFRELAPPAALLAGTPSMASGGKTASMLRWITGGRIRRLALASLPLPLLQAAWRLYSRWTFDALSRHAPPVAFKPGDVLFMGDASWHYEAWHAMQRARQQGCRVVLMVHDLIPLRHPEYGAPLVSMVFEKWLARMLSGVDAVICNSQATEGDLKNYAASVGLSLPPTGHFRLGCDLVRQPGVQAIRPVVAHFLGKPGVSFAAIGSFEPRKNYAWLLQVFEGLWGKGHNVRLLIAGRPTADGRALVEKMKQHPEQGRRLLTVFDASDQELDHVYAHARALLFPSLAEGFGLPLVEARTRGCLVIASDLPVFRELADEGVSLCVENTIGNMDALVMAHAEVAFRTKVTPMPAFTWKDSAQQCLQVMSGLLTDLPSSRGPSQASLSKSWPTPAPDRHELLSN